MKRIAFVTDNLLTIGGVQRVLAVIAIELSKKHHVSIITLEDESNCDYSLYGLDKSLVEIIHFHPKGKQSFLHKAVSGVYKKLHLKGQLMSEIYAHSSFPSSQRKEFIHLINQGAYDTVIAVHGGLSVKLASIRKHLNVNRLLGWMHNSYEAFFLNHRSYYPDQENHFMYQLRKLDNLIVLCKADACRYEERMKLHPSVIYNPLTLVPGTPSNGQNKTFLSIGRMVPLHKGFDILIDAFAHFAKNNQDWNLKIVGEGAEENKLRKQIASYGLENRIEIAPFTSDIQSVYHDADIYVMSSRWEGMPLVLVEALSHGLPIIAPTLPVVQEILSDKVALFFPTGNSKALGECMLKKEELLGMREATIPHSNAFLIEKIIEMWNDII